MHLSSKPFSGIQTHTRTQILEKRFKSIVSLQEIKD